MSIEDYKTLISVLPVGQQSFTTKRSTWRKAENSKEIKWLADMNQKLFDNRDELTISRQDIFDTKNSIRELTLKTIYWGYEGGMRGNHFVNILEKILKLETTFEELKGKENLTSSDFDNLTKTLKGISGIGLSTYSKLLYFLKIKFNNNPCLILDQKLINVINSKFYDEYLPLGKINDYNKEEKYLPFLEITNKISLRLGTKGENIEHFLFTFGNNLKLTNE